MTRATGRRTAERRQRAAPSGPRPGPGRLGPGVAAALATVLLTAGSLALAGAVEPPEAAREADPDAVTLSERTYSCVGGLADTSAIHGSLPEGSVRNDVGKKPLRLVVPQDRARDSFATQSARNGASLAVLPCPEPRSRWWFVGAGAAIQHGSTLVIDNPRPGSAVVNIDVFGPLGDVEAPGLQGITIPGGATRTYRLSDFAPAVGELAVRVIATRGLVSVAAPEKLDVGADEQAREWVPSQQVPRKVLTLVGLPRKPGSSTLLVANPGEVEAVVEVELVGPKGPFAPRRTPTISVPPRSVAEADLTRAFDGEPSAVRLTSPVPVVATVRGVAQDDETYATSVAPLRGVSVLGVPAADSRELVLTAGAARAVVALTTYDENGKVRSRRSVIVRPDTTVRVPLGDAVRFTRLVSGGSGTVAGLFIRDSSAGVAAAGISPAVQALRLPVIRPGW